MNALPGAVAAGTLSGILHGLALRPGGALLAWVALVPLLHVAARLAPRQVACAVLAYVSALLALDVAPWFGSTIARYFELARPVAWAVGMMAVALTAVAYAAPLALALVLRGRSAPRLGIVWCAALWSAWEALRTALVPPYFPLAILGTSQVGALPVLQVASLAGLAGVTALLVAMNAAVAQLTSRAMSPGRRRAALGSVAVLAIGVALWGSRRLDRAPAPSGDEPRVLLVDGAAANAAASTFERYIAVTTAHAIPSPTVVVWPESALSMNLEEDVGSWDRVSGFVEELGVPLVTGGAGSAVESDGRVARFNSVHFIRPGHGMTSYHKRLLVPFAESWPAVLGSPPSSIEPVSPGTDLVVFGEGRGRFAPLVCFEITDAASGRALARAGAQFIVNLNNDVWFGGGTAPQLVWARVRAVESGLPVVRATNRGTSAIIDPFGRIIVSAHADGVPVALAGAVPRPVATLYARTGDLPVPACLLVVLGGLLGRRRSVTAAATRTSAS